MALNRIDLLNHDFPRSFRGYAPAEVDRFIQELADTIARLGEEKLLLANRAAQLEVELDKAGQRETALRETVLSTQRMLEDIKEAAQREAQRVIETAQTRAENLSAQADLRLARITERIADARKLKAQLDLRLRAVLASHLKLLEMEREEDEQALAAQGRAAGKS